MGFKEVMALRQEGSLEEALALAREDYKKTQDQWSSSALFWVLKDIVSLNIEEGNTDKAAPLIHEMEEIVGNMGANANVAMETLKELQKSSIPHFNELSELVQEIQQCRNRQRIKEIYTLVNDWLGKQDTPPHELLHEGYAQILYSYLSHYYQHISVEEVEEVLQRYLSLKNSRPHTLHSDFLKLALRAKQYFTHRFSLSHFVALWDISLLTSADWERGKYGTLQGEHSLAELVLFELTTEAINREDEVPSEAILTLLSEANNRYPEDELLQLSQARVLVMEKDLEQAVERYEHILQDSEVAMAWAEYAYLIKDNKELRMSALCMALREERDEYQEYLGKARTELAKLLIEQGLYANALRELTFVSQLSIEKGRELPTGFEELMQQIPKGTIMDRENMDFYYKYDRVALAHIYRALPSQLMMVYDVMAMRLKGNNNNQVVPMLKLMTAQGKTALVTPKESGVLPGDNRGLVYEVKLYERYKKHTKVVQMTHIPDYDSFETFPTKVGIINGYSESKRAYHVMDNNSRHHYMPGQPNQYVQGEFIKFVLLIENQQRKNQPPVPPREYIYHVERIDPMDAINTFDPVKAEVEEVQNDTYLLRTERGITSIVNQSISPVALEKGNPIIIRGFQNRHKDRITGQVSYSFVTLAIEPYFG